MEAIATMFEVPTATIFTTRWACSGRPVRAFHDKARTMPPASTASLPDDMYANIAAYIFEVNRFEAGKAKLPAGGKALDKTTIR